MTDRELLLSAAKAAGVELDYGIRPDGKAFFHSERIALALADGGWFAPLTDDGDALRLAVRLGIHLTNSQTDAWATTLTVTEIESIGDDPCAATRRAIVRAAAAIGEAME